MSCELSYRPAPVLQAAIMLLCDIEIVLAGRCHLCPHKATPEVCTPIFEGHLGDQAMPIEAVHLCTTKLQNACQARNGSSPLKQLGYLHPQCESDVINHSLWIEYSSREHE